jgi:hypothetical protein
MQQPPSPVVPPCESAIVAWYSGADLLDSYSVRLGPGRRTTMRSLAEAAFANPPMWYQTLLAVRDGAMKAFGVKSSSEVRRETAPDQRIDFIPIHAISIDEIVVGEDDRHLNFRLSLLRRRFDDGDEIIATTVNRDTGCAIGSLAARFEYSFEFAKQETGRYHGTTARRRLYVRGGQIRNIGIAAPCLRVSLHRLSTDHRQRLLAWRGRISRCFSGHWKGPSTCSADTSRERSNEEAWDLSGLRCMVVRRSSAEHELSWACQGGPGWNVR